MRGSKSYKRPRSTWTHQLLNFGVALAGALSFELDDDENKRSGKRRRIPTDHTEAVDSSQHNTSCNIILQPETRPISHEQLVAEVRGIYAGLVMVEAKCIDVDNKQAGLASLDLGVQLWLNNEQWQALIAVHRTLLPEHHDFFLASQLPLCISIITEAGNSPQSQDKTSDCSWESFQEPYIHDSPSISVKACGDQDNAAEDIV